MNKTCMSIAAIILSTSMIAKTSFVAQTPLELTNELTVNHVSVPGTKISLIPPEGFELSDQYLGFEKGYYGIVVFDLPGGDFESNTRGFNEDSLRAEGLFANELTRLKINGYDAIFADMQKGKRMFILAFGDSTFSAVITAEVPLIDMALKDEVKESMLSVYYSEEEEIDPFDFAKFEIDLSNTNLKFSGHASGMYFFNTEGLENPRDHPSGATLFISQLPSDPQRLNDLEGFTTETMNRLRDKGADVTIIDRGEEVISGLKAQFVNAQLDINGSDLDLILFVTGNQDQMFMIQAMVFADFENNSKVLLEAIRTMKIKAPN